MKTANYYYFLLIVIFFFSITTTQAQCDWIYEGRDADSYVIEGDTVVLFYCYTDTDSIYVPAGAQDVFWQYTTTDGTPCTSEDYDDGQSYFYVNSEDNCITNSLEGGRIDIECSFQPTDDAPFQQLCHLAIVFFAGADPKISVSDINLTYNAGETPTVCEESMIDNMLTLTATGLGSSPPGAEYTEYQWYLGGVAIEGANSVSLEVSNTDYNINNPGINTFHYEVSNFCTHGEYIDSEPRSIVIYEGYGEECDPCQWYFPDYEANQFYIFTPNDDGVADYFPEAPNNESNRINEINEKLSQPTCEATIYRLSVYNRLGREVFISEYDNHPWDGKLKNGRTCKDGTYFYKLEYVLNPHIPDPEQNQTKVSTGTIYLDSGN